jgi:pSer/pThr/pTyr-binding forkhead associated (FHA) protein
LARAVLICINGDRPQLLKDRATIGRQKSCDIVLPIEAISKHHATIYREADAWYIRDEKSTNGTFVNGIEISKPTAISPGDIVRLNNSADITFKSSAAEDATAPGWGNLTDVVRELGNRLHLLEQGMGQLADGVKSLAERQEADEEYKICAKEYDEKAREEIEALKLAGESLRMESARNKSSSIEMRKAIEWSMGFMVVMLLLIFGFSITSTQEDRQNLLASASKTIQEETGAVGTGGVLIVLCGGIARHLAKTVKELDESDQPPS